MENLRIKLHLTSSTAYAVLRDKAMTSLLAHCFNLTISHQQQPIQGLVDVVPSLRYGATIKLDCQYDETDVMDACLSRPDVCVRHVRQSLPSIPSLLQLPDAKRTKYLNNVLRFDVVINSTTSQEHVLDMLHELNPNAMISLSFSIQSSLDTYDTLFVNKLLYFFDNFADTLEYKELALAYTTARRELRTVSMLCSASTPGTALDKFMRRDGDRAIMTRVVRMFIQW